MNGEFVPRLEAAQAYNGWFGRGQRKYAFGVESRALLSAVGLIHGRWVLDVG
jgi:hypothetical protein